MGQAGVLKILEKNSGWITAEEIHREEGISVSSICRVLNILYHHREVLFKKERINGRKTNLWRIK